MPGMKARKLSVSSKNKHNSTDNNGGDPSSCSATTTTALSARPPNIATDIPPITGPTSGRSYKSKRTVLTRNACIRCRVAKTKCNGKHPSCARCQAGGVQCTYDVTSEGITKMQDLQQKLETRTHDLARAMTVLAVMQRGSDQDATEVLARLRLGDPLERVADALEAKSPPIMMTIHEATVPPHASMQRSRTLPPSPVETCSGQGSTYNTHNYNTPTTHSSPSHPADDRRDSIYSVVTPSQPSRPFSMSTPSPTCSEGPASSRARGSHPHFPQ